MRLPDDYSIDDVSDVVKFEKEVHVRATFRRSLPTFTQSVITDPLNLTDPVWIDSCTYLTGILRVTSVGDVLYYQYISDIHGAYPAWTNTGITLKAGSRPAVDQGYIHYQQADGQVFYRAYWAWGSPVSVATVANPCHLAPIATRCYAIWQRNAGSYEIRCLNGQDSSQYAVFGPASLPRLDVVSFNGFEYFYTMDRDEGRVIEIKHSGGATSGKDSYGVAKPIIPIDAIDQNYGFKLAYASVVDSQVVVTGMMTRTSDDVPVQFDAYAVGPEYFSFGREMLVQAGNGQFGGKMLRVGNEFVLMGADRMYIALATNVFGGATHPSLEFQTSDFANFKLSESEGRSSTLDMEVSTDLSHTALQVGSDVTLELAYNDIWTQLAKCHVQIDATNEDEQGKTRQVSGIGKSAKRLAMWSPEQGVYIPSQANVYDYPSQMTKFVRVQGDWVAQDAEDPTSAVQLNSLNKWGVMYSTARAARGGAMRAKFFSPATDANFKAQYGVVINYYRETAAEAAARLGADVASLTEEQYGHNGIAAIYGPTEHSGGSGIALYLWKDGIFTKLTSVSYTIPTLTWHWLQIEFIEGEIRVKYKPYSTGTSWSDVITFMYNNSVLPWQSDTLGRGAIIAKNVVPTVTYYGLGPDDLTLGVENNTVFPSAGTILLDDEQITYSGRSTFNTADINPGWSSCWNVRLGEQFKPGVGFTGPRVVTAGIPNTWADGSFANAAACFVQGENHPYPSPGQNRTFRIIGYDKSIPTGWDPVPYEPGWSLRIGITGFGSWITQAEPTGNNGVYMDPDPWTVIRHLDDMDNEGPFSAFRIKPSFFITARGANDTVATTHTGGTALLYTTKSVLIAEAGSFTQDEDQTMEDALRTIIHMAGGKFSCQATKYESHTFTAGSGLGFWNDHRNFVASLTVPTLNDGFGVGMAFRAQTGYTNVSGFPYANANGAYYLELQRTGSAYYLDLYELWPVNSKTLIERVPIRPANTNSAGTANVPSGTLKISVQNDLFSVWLNGRYLHTFFHNTYADDNRTSVIFWSRQAGIMYCYLSELDDLLADIVVGVRGNGMSVVQELIADRGIKWRDNADGSMYFYKNRLYRGDIPDILSGVSTINTDDYITRARAEGMYISEVLNPDALYSFGNSFVTINARYANTVEESRMAAECAINESFRESRSKRYTLVLHPCIQPGDTYNFYDVPSNPGWQNSMIVRSQSLVVGFFGSNFVCDMQCEVMPADLEF